MLSVVSAFFGLINLLVLPWVWLVVPRRLLKFYVPVAIVVMIVSWGFANASHDDSGVGFAVGLLFIYLANWVSVAGIVIRLIHALFTASKKQLEQKT